MLDVEVTRYSLSNICYSHFRLLACDITFEEPTCSFGDAMFIKALEMSTCYVTVTRGTQQPSMGARNQLTGGGGSLGHHIPPLCKSIVFQ